MPAKFFNWPPFKLVALDADTGKPLDPTVGMRTYHEFYDVKKDGNGKKVIVAHKSSDNGSKKSEGKTEDMKKNENGGGAKAEDVEKKGNGGSSKDAKADEGGEKKQGGGGQDGDRPWTAEEDDKLRAMKAEKKSWADIEEAIGRPGKAVCKPRYQELTKDDNANGAKKEESKNDDASKNNHAKKPNEGAKDKSKGAKGGDNKPENKGQKNDQKGVEKEASKAAGKEFDKSASKAESKSGNGEARFTLGEWRTLQEDDLFSFGELQCLSELMMRDEAQLFTRIASDFRNITGRRVHPDDIRDKFSEMQG